VIVAEVLARYDRELRGSLPYFDAAVRLERDGTVVRLLGATADAMNNCVLFSALDSATAGAAIDRQVAYFNSLSRGFEWKHHDHDAPANLRALLAARGFTPSEPETIMAVELSSGPPDFSAPPGYEARALADGESLAPLMEVQNAVWPEEKLDWLHESLARERAARPDAIRFHAVWHADRPVSVGWTRLHGSFAALYGGSTVKAHRGMGLYRALVSSRLAEARARGSLYGLTDAGPMSRPILARLGFTALTGTTPFLHPAPKPKP